MACKADSDCPTKQVCNDGVCEPASGFSEEKETVTFAKKRHDISLDVQADLRQLDIYSQFVDDELAEAMEERTEEAEDIDFWGKVGAIGGSILGGIGGCILGGPGGCVAGAVKGATVGTFVASGVTRTVTDYLGDAEDYGLTDTEMAMFDESDFKYLKEEFFDLRKTAEEYQEDLDAYDEDQWKTHVMSTLDDTWTAFQVANTAASVAGVIESAGQATGETFPIGEGGSLADRLSIATLPETTDGWSETISDITSSMIDQPLGQQLRQVDMGVQ